MCVKSNSFFDREMKIYYVTQVLKQGINIKFSRAVKLFNCKVVVSFVATFKI